MLEFIKHNLTNITALLSLFFSVVALVVTSIIVVKGWWKQRNIYKLEWHRIQADTMTFNPTGMETNEINKKLGSGKYTIMHTNKDSNGYDILLGKIKK